MSDDVNWSEVRELLDALYSTTDRLETLFPGRKFTLDGHLVGSIGEVIAAYMFGLSLFRGSNKGHDATAQDGRNVEVKLTQGESVSIRHEPDHLVVLQRKKGGTLEIVFNGPGQAAWEKAGKMQSNGQRPIRLGVLRALDRQVLESERLTVARQSPV